MLAGRPHHDPGGGFAELSQTARDATGPGRGGRGGAAGGGRPVPGPGAGRGAPRGRRAMALLPALLLLLLPLAALAAALAAVLLGLPSYDIPPGVNQPAKLRLVLAVLLGTAALVSRALRSAARGRGWGVLRGEGGQPPPPPARTRGRATSRGGAGARLSSRRALPASAGLRLRTAGSARRGSPLGRALLRPWASPAARSEVGAGACQHRLLNGGGGLSLAFGAEPVFCLVTALSFRRSHLAQGKLQPFNCSCRG